MIGTIFNCPLSGNDLCHPCPVRQCPANLADLNPEHSCAHRLEDISYPTLAQISGLDVAEIRQMSQAQATALGYLMHDLKQVLDAPLENSCSECGYVQPCTSRSLCAERREIVEEILVKIRGEGVTSLRAGHLWHAVLHGLARFLSPQQVTALEELVNQRHRRTEL